MPTSNEAILRQLIGHQIGVQRWGTRVSREAVKLLAAADKDVRAQLERRLSRIQERGFDLGPTSTTRLRETEKAIAEILGEAHKTAAAAVKGELGDLAVYEAGYTGDLLDRTVPVSLAYTTPSAGTLRQLATKEPIHGKQLGEWLDTLRRSDVQRATQAIRLGLVEGQSVQQITSRVLGTARLRYADGVRQVTYRGAEMLVRTASNHVANRAREVFLGENEDIVKKVQWVSVLDGRTTLVCMARDGKLYEVNVGPRPPAHPNCRSTIVPYLDGEDIATRPTITDTRTRRDRERDFKAEAREQAGESWRSMSRAERNGAIRGRRAAWVKERVGAVPAKTTFDDWLKDQPVPFQNDVLGATRAKLYRQGGVPLDRFVDTTGRSYTLDELRIRDRDAFTRAGV